jgi:Zn finger protein HypA/HybF involved in hydrogenase expression
MGLKVMMNQYLVIIKTLVLAVVCRSCGTYYFKAYVDETCPTCNSWRYRPLDLILDIEELLRLHNGEVNDGTG